MKRPRGSLVVLLALLIVPPCSARAAESEATRRVEAGLPGLVAERMVRGNLPGVCVVLVRGEEIVYAAGFGRKSLAFPDPVTPRTVFRVASLTKQFTALAILLLEEEGVLSLEDPVVERLDWFATRDGRHGAIRIGHLLSHRSGLPRGPYYAARHPSARGQVEDLASMDLAYQPGTTFKYSNAAYQLAGYLLEVVTGRTYEALVRERILGPLGLERSGFVLDGALAADFATGYQTDHYRSLVVEGDRLRAAPLYPAPDAAGNLFASGEDVARFLLLLLNGGRLGGEQVVSEGAIRRMLTPVEESAYGLGVGVGRRLGRACLQHTGGYFGHSSLLLGFPDEKVGGVVLINRASAHQENFRILDHALALLLGEEPPPAAVGDPALAGRYSDGELSVEVQASGRALYLLDDGRAYRLEPFWSDRRYLVSGGRLRGWPLDFSAAESLIAGPVRLERASSAPLRRAPPSSVADRLAGTYRDDDVGEAVVFRRGEELFFSFSRSEQVPLIADPEDPFRFTISGGSFAGEPAEFTVVEGRAVALRAGYMEYRRGSF